MSASMSRTKPLHSYPSLAKKVLWSSLFLTLPIAPAYAAHIYGGAGTTGVFLGVGQDLNTHLGFRIEGGYLDHDKDLKTSSVKYNVKLKMKNVGTFLDLYPFSGLGFRLTAGAFIGDNTVRGYSDTVRYKGSEYTLPSSEHLRVDAKYKTFRPYLGLGYTPKSRFGIFGDIGVAYGKLSNVTVTATPLIDRFYGARLERERQEVEDKLEQNKYKFYPVVRLGVQYRFK